MLSTVVNQVNLTACIKQEKKDEVIETVLKKL